MPLGATSLLAPVPTKKMGFTIESLVGGGTTPPKSDSGSPPLRHHSLANSRMFSSDLGSDITRDRYFPSDNSFSSRDLQSGLLFHRDIMALQRQHQEQQIASECLIREQLFLRHRAQLQEQYNHQEQMKRNSLNRELIHQEISRELLNSRINSDFDQRRSPNCENSTSTKNVKSSPRSSPRGSPRSSPSLPRATSSPQSYIEEDRRSSASPISNNNVSSNNNNNNNNRSTSPLSSLKKHQSSSPNLISPGGLPPHPAGSFLSPLQHSSMLPNLPPQFLPLGGGGGGGGPSPIHIPTPMVQHHLLGGGLPQGLGNNLGGGGLGAGLGTPLPAVARDFPLYPWLISARHGRVFPPGFPGQDGYPGFLLPFRKPKRIRTAFSPSQLLKLEQAFEKNQYVVGQERKQLAQNLNLSETQVKVWFQNRRTKHKRQQQEDEEGGGGKTGSEGDKSAEEGLIIEHEEEDEELDVLEEAGEV